MQFDPQFVDRIIQQDELAFAQFYEQSVDIFFSYIKSHYFLDDEEIQDLLSEIYLKIWNNIDKFNTDYTFGQFIWTIVKNHCKDYFKTTKPLSFSQIGSDFEWSDEKVISSFSYLIQEDDVIENMINTQYTYEYIQHALEKLDEEEQELIHSRYILWYSYDTLADMYGMRHDALRQKLSRSLKKLRKNLWFLSEIV